MYSRRVRSLERPAYFTLQLHIIIQPCVSTSAADQRFAELFFFSARKQGSSTIEVRGRTNSHRRKSVGLNGLQSQIVSVYLYGAILGEGLVTDQEEGDHHAEQNECGQIELDEN